MQYSAAYVSRVYHYVIMSDHFWDVSSLCCRTPVHAIIATPSLVLMRSAPFTVSLSFRSRTPRMLRQTRAKVAHNSVMPTLTMPYRTYRTRLIGLNDSTLISDCHQLCAKCYRCGAHSRWLLYFRLRYDDSIGAHKAHFFCNHIYSCGFLHQLCANGSKRPKQCWICVAV